MNNRTMRITLVTLAGVAFITLVAFAIDPVMPPNTPTGWYWTGEGLLCGPPMGYCRWDEPDNWEWHGLAVPTWQYPQDPDDDVYLTCP